MLQTHSEIMKELLPLYEKDPRRFMRFYDAVFLKLSDIPEGGVLKISDCCNNADIELFKKIAGLLMIEETARKSVTDDVLEFTEDETEIRRSRKFIPSRPLFGKVFKMQ